MTPDTPPPRPAAGWRRFIRLYDTGLTPVHACAADQRFAYRLYVPRSFDPEGAERHAVLVDVHGTWREDHRPEFAEFCERHGVVLFAPLFPASVIEPGEMDSYKFIAFHDIRFDLLLLEMLREVTPRYRLDWGRLLLFGFSGGAQFAHRFLYLHPGVPRAVSLAAPGSVTLPDPGLAWWRGVGDLEARFGRRFDPGALRGMAVQCLVGAEDTDVQEITVRPGQRDWCEGANDAGPTRVARARTLCDAMRRAGLDSRLDLVPGAAHEVERLIPDACRFFAQILARSAR